jgi:hypothetical protein
MTKSPLQNHDSSACSAPLQFTLPVTVDWSVLDDFLLRRHWVAGRGRERAELPELADRILIFHRGVDVVGPTFFLDHAYFQRFCIF